ncbi:uncharacterized protein EI90DRAFT_3063481 [Cantharellus anzutake]|uniref:uncharacterized protein n=1 Tax=Cantharellus anzutake TaxID=1750568 RepID=UPI0019036BB4|nr:uncharacterized protein EI90DRAFT_3063481 [Cantharellus anzutake]KAF8329179.1 hypothetical protein EI90DRAFT_3063481 [Cantharellus anzutake]
MAIRITSITTLLESSLQGNPPVNQEPSITYDPIGDNPSSFSKPFPILIHKVVLSVLNEIDSGSESISQFTALIEDSRISRAVESVLNAIKICYKSADHIFCSPDAPRILSSTRELLSMLRQALHEHLHACHGSQGARTISSSFSRSVNWFHIYHGLQFLCNSCTILCFQGVASNTSLMGTGR